jgi:hypothetical protein
VKSEDVGEEGVDVGVGGAPGAHEADDAGFKEAVEDPAFFSEGPQ